MPAEAATINDRSADPVPIVPRNRGLSVLSTAKLTIHRERYRRFQERLDVDRGVWPEPESARRYVAEVIAEIEDALAARASPTVAA